MAYLFRKLHTGKYLKSILFMAVISIIVSCGAKKEISVEELAILKQRNGNELLRNTVYKPGPPQYVEGQKGGTYVTYLSNDPKTFNTLLARDGDSRRVINFFYPSLFDYNPYEKKFVANVADFEINFDQEKEITTVLFTLKDDLYWTSADGEKIKITVDDVVFWYEEVDGDPAVQSPGYPGQFIVTPDGEQKRVEIKKLDNLRAEFIIPSIIADPILSTNMSFGPRYIFEKAKKEGGVSAMINILSIDTPPKSIPSGGRYMLSEYQPGQYVKIKKNPNYWKKDDYGNSLPYIDTIEFQIIPSEDAALLKFKQGDLTAYAARPEDLNGLIKDKDEDNYSVYDGGGSLGSSFFTLNQNSNTVSEEKLAWFSNKYFRQAMSRIIPRQRIIDEVYRGLGEPAVYFFSKSNPLFDENIRLEYTYNLEKAMSLLAQMGIKKNAEGLMEDATGNLIDFDLNIGVSSSLAQDMAILISEEAKKIGVTINVKPIDFQTLVDKLTKSYNWEAVIVGLGANNFPSSGSNVWLSKGNFHLWNPLQDSPATDWEAKIDELYKKGRVTIDAKERKKVYDEYQQLILEELPLMYLIYPKQFSAYQNNVGNVFVDNLEGSKIEYLYIEE